MKRSAQDETKSQGIGGINQEFVATGYVGGTADFRDNGRIGTEACYACHLATEGCAQDTFNDEGFIFAQFAAGVVYGGAGADAGACGAAIHLAIGKDADIAAVVLRVVGVADDNGSVKEAQLFFKGVLDRPLGHNGLLDTDAGVDQLVEVAPA